MKIIKKFVFEPRASVGEQHVELDQTAEILSIQKQRESIAMWVSEPSRGRFLPVAADAPAEITLRRRTFVVLLTGDGVPPRHEHRATVQFDNGAFVAHLFEIV